MINRRVNALAGVDVAVTGGIIHYFDVFGRVVYCVKYAVTSFVNIQISVVASVNVGAACAVFVNEMEKTAVVDENVNIAGTTVNLKSVGMIIVYGIVVVLVFRLQSSRRGEDKIFYVFEIQSGMQLVVVCPDPVQSACVTDS